jgi:hypothetical protein
MTGVVLYVRNTPPIGSVMYSAWTCDADGGEENMGEKKGTLVAGSM